MQEAADKAKQVRNDVASGKFNKTASVSTGLDYSKLSNALKDGVITRSEWNSARVTNPATNSYGSINVFVPGFGGDLGTFKGMINTLTTKSANKFIDAGNITVKGGFQSSNSYNNILSANGINSTLSVEQQALILKAKGYNLMFNTENSDVNSGNMTKANELADFIDLASFDTGKVNIIGHSQGGLVGMEYTMESGKGKVNNFISIDSPFNDSWLATVGTVSEIVGYTPNELSPLASLLSKIKDGPARDDITLSTPDLKNRWNEFAKTPYKPYWYAIGVESDTVVGLDSSEAKGYNNKEVIEFQTGWGLPGGGWDHNNLLRKSDMANVVMDLLLGNDVVSGLIGDAKIEVK